MMSQLLLSAMVVFATLNVCASQNTGFFSGFSLRGQTYPNHGLVLREDIGETDNSDLDPNNGLNCISFSGCCVSPVPTSQRGEFFFPGSTNQVPILSNIGSGGYYRNRAADRNILNRRSPDGTTTGIFECGIRTDTFQTEYQIFYVGVYDAGAGSPTISGVTLSSDNRTLTCTSTGGPATTVVWRQNCIILQQNNANYVQNQVVTNTLTANYENTLETDINTISNGVYTCSVGNIRGYDSSSVGVGTDYSSPLPITVSITSSSSTPTAGQSFTLTCQATTALTSPSYQWFGNSGGMIGSGSTLTLNPLLESSSGEYSCQVTARSGAGQRFGCGVIRVDVQAPSLTVTIKDVANAVAGQSHTLSCSVTGSNLETATIMYTWRLSTTVLQGPSTSNMYNIAMVQVSNAGDVYTCEVTVTASYWDVSGSFGDSGSGTLSVTIPTPTIQFTRLVLESLYVGLPFSWRCEMEIPGNQLAGVTADVEWRGPGGAVITNNSRITVGATTEPSPGREYHNTLMFSPLSAGDSGSYSCSATVMPKNSYSLVTNGVGTGSDSLTVADTTLAVNLKRTSIPPRVFDLPSYNGFTLTCTATSRAVNIDVAVAKSITWMRSVDGGNSQVLTDSDMFSSEFVMISSTDLQMATAISTLKVNTTVPGSHVYTCIVNLSIMPAPDVILEQAMTTILVQAVAPNLPVGLSASDISHNSATISWTVTSLSYGPETYVVQYGTDMNTLDQTSSMETSGSDITLTNFTLSISLTGLQMMTTYYYRVIAMNDGGGMTRSVTVGTFNTSTPIPGPPRMLEGVASTNLDGPPSLTFNWLVPNVTNGDILDYSLTCVSEGIPTPPSVTSTTTSATITNLENGLQYCCTVTARNEHGTSLPSVAQYISTIEIAPTGEPQGFMTRATDSRNVTFTWLLPVLTERNGNITSYNLTCVSTTTGREAFLTRVYHVAESNSYTITRLKPDTSYTCRVFAINSVGRGPTANLSLTTQPDEPDGPPQDITFTLVDGDPSQVQFNFNPPREDLQNGFIIEYRISCVDRNRTRDAVAMIYQSSLPRPYTLSNLVPATLYYCSLSARTSPGFGVEATVEVLTIAISTSITASGTNIAGETYSLECSATVTGSTDQPTITWLDPMNNSVPSEMDTTTGSMSTLTFNPLETSHAGTYTCRVTAGGKTVTQTSTVIVNVITAQVTRSSSGPLTAGQTGFFLSCDVTGTENLNTPTFTYQWRRNGGVISGQQGSTLSLSSLTASNAGEYNCSVTISATSLSSTVTVNSGNTETVSLLRPLPPPTNLFVSHRSSPASISLTWEQPPEAFVVDGFKITYTYVVNECRDENPFHFLQFTVTLNNGSLRGYTIINSSLSPLEEDSVFTISVTAFNSVTESNKSITATTTTAQAAPGVVQSLNFGSVSITNITIQWDRVACQDRNGEVDAYRVVYYPTEDSTDSNTEPIAGTNDDDRMLSVTGLPPRTSYTFEVQAFNTEIFVLGATATLTVSTSAPQNFGFLLDGQLYPNNSVVTLTDIGNVFSGPALFCLTPSTECCSDTETPNEATVTREWYLPDGRQLSSAGTVFSREQVSSAVSLYRNGGTSLSGVFRCDVPGASGNSQSIYIGLYPSTDGSPSITSVLFDRDVTTLTCTSTGGPPTSVTWRKNGVPVNNSLYQQSQRVVDTTTATYESLLFNDDISNFIGNFKCEVSNVRATVGETVELDGVSIQRDQFIVGGSATVACKSDTLANRIEWLTDGVVVESVTSTQQLDLVFPLVNDSIHNQDYTCRVTREAGMTATQKFTVKVDVPPDAVTASVSRSGTARAGMIYSLTCTVSKISGFVNSPTATWTTGGMTVSNGNDISVSSTSSDTSSSSSTLTFDPLRTSHGNIYSCDGSLNSPALEEPLITSTTETHIVQISNPNISITVPPGPLYAGRTTPLTLTCTISINSATDTTISVTDMDITWLNGSASLSNSDDRVTISPLSGSQQPFTSNLTLSPLSTFDSTSFTCRAQARPQANVQTLVTASEQREGTVSVTVVSPLPPTVNIVHSISPVMAGQPLTLTCSATVQEGIDVSPTLTWTKDGVEQSSGSVLTFDRLLTSHGGVYTCTARLNIPEAGVDVYRTNTTTIVVQIPPPSITITGSPRNVTFFQSLVLNLTCCAELHSAVDSPVSVEGYWEMNGTRLQNTNSGDERLMVTNNFMESLPYYSIIIRLNPMTFRDAGTYACFANVTPHVSDFISGPELPTSNQRTINIQALPSPAINLFSRQPSSDGCGEAMSLNCTFELVAGFVVPPTTSWVDPNGREVSTDESANPQTDSQLLIFNNITAANTGIYTCQVVIGGNVEASTSIDINNKVLGVPQNLQCSVSSSSSELSFSWELPTVLASEVIDYRVEVKGLRHRDGTREVVQFEVDGFNTEMKETTISEGLDGEVPYNITVRALNLAGCGEVQQIYCFTREGVPPRPEEVKIAISNSTTLSVSWKRFTLVELKGLASYVITYRATSESSAQANNAIISVPWTQNYTVVTGLSPVVEYNIAVSTATMNQMSEPVQMHITTSTTVTTAQDSPGTEMPNTGSGSTIPIIIGVVVAIIVMVTIILVVIVILVIIRMKRRRAEINFEKTRMLRAFNQPVGIMSGTVERYSIDIDAEKEESCKKEGEFLQTSQTVECELVETTAAVPVTFTAAPKTQTSTMESKENELS